MNFQVCIMRVQPMIECAYPVIWKAWCVRWAAGFVGGEPDPKTNTTNTMMPIMILERSCSFNTALNRQPNAQPSTKMLSLGTMEASPGVVHVFSVHFSV
jgi:hypothetical protein